MSAVAKALKDFARANPLLVIKGGLADGSLLSSSDLSALADLPPRDVLLARLAGALAAPMQQMAGLLQALPRSLAYGLSALIEQREAGGEKLPEAVAEAPAEAEAERRQTQPRLQRQPPAAAEAEATRGGCAEDAAQPRGGCGRRGTGRRRSRIAGPAPQVEPTDRTQTEGKKGRPLRWQGP